jgi:hypothetical protein
MNDKHVHFLPFHAINEFMLPEYRQQVIGEVFGGLDAVSSAQRGILVNLFKKHVSIPGFRNSNQAPQPIKLRSAVTQFEKNPAFAAAVIGAWSELHTELRDRMHGLLAERGWDLLPADADRARLPGFRTEWPKTDTFEVLDGQYRSAYPDDPASDDDLNLMAVWLGNRLPYDLYAEDSADAEETA